MPFNSTDFQSPPWASGLMTLTHDEVVHVQTVAGEIEAEYKPEDNYYQPISDMYVQAEYNKVDWTKGVNGDTYSVIKQYDPEVNTQGINESGIVPEVEESTEEAPADEPEELTEV